MSRKEAVCEICRQKVEKEELTPVKMPCNVWLPKNFEGDNAGQVLTTKDFDLCKECFTRYERAVSISLAEVFLGENRREKRA